MLTEQQISQYETFGFLVLRQVFSQEELQTINDEIESGLAATTRQSSPGEENKFMSWSNLGPDAPFLAGLLEDLRFIEAAEQLHGEDAVGVSCNSGSYVGDTAWHPDSHERHMHGVKFACYPQPVDAETGALRVIPGSHNEPFSGEVERHLKDAEPDIGDVPASVCKSEPGDVVAFNNRLWHASCGGWDDRRMCSLIYKKNPETPEEEEATRKWADATRQTRGKLLLETFQSPRPEYHPDWLANPEGSTRRQRWIDWMRDWGYIDLASHESRALP